LTNKEAIERTEYRQQTCFLEAVSNYSCGSAE